MIDTRAPFLPLTIDPNIQDAPAGWRWVKLTDVARLESGHTPSRLRPDWWGGEISWLSLTEIRALDRSWVYQTQLRTNAEGIANSAARILPKGTVCLSRTASVGFVTIMGQPMATSQDFANWVCTEGLDPEFLMYALLRSRDFLRDLASGATHKTIYMPTLEAFRICMPDLPTQKEIARKLQLAFASFESARAGARTQLAEVSALADAFIRDSIKTGGVRKRRIGDVLEEVKRGIGGEWKSHPVLGATRDGIAPAKESPGKHGEKYKPVITGSVFYNPMRILIGSIAMVDEGDESGITSPDYVVLRGINGISDSRWLYFWLRSPLGSRCIQSLARGAVRERMLFNRLAEGEIFLPDFTEQQRTSSALRELTPMMRALRSCSSEINHLSRKILSAAFETETWRG